MKTRLLFLFLIAFAFANAQAPNILNVTAQNVTSTTAIINFQLQNNCQTYSYRAELSTSATFSNLNSSTFIANNYCSGTAISHSTTFSNPSLLPNTTYYFRVRVDISGGNTYYSTAGSFITAGLAPVFGTPTAIPSTNSAQINYALVAGVGSSTMTVYWGTSAASLTNSITATPILNSGSSSTTISGLNPQTVYFYNISAVSSNGSIISTTGSFTTLSLASLIVAEYNFDNSYTNTNGNTPFANISNTTSFVADRNSVANNALQVVGNANNGTTSYVLAPTGNSSRTISFWFKANGGTGGVIAYGGSSQYNTFGAYYTTNGNIYFQGFSYDHNFGGVYNDNQWKHIVLTYDGTNVKLYTNGILTGTIARPLLSTSVGSNFRIGTNQNTLQFDDLKIYNVALAQTEISNLYTNNALSSTDFSQNNLKVSLYPNPVKDILNIETASEIKSVEIYNLLGQKVKTANSKNINVADLSNGTYMVRVQDTNNAVETMKIVKQ